VSHRITTLASAQPLRSCSPVLIYMHVHSTDLISHCITHESHLEFIISTLCSEEANTSYSYFSHKYAPNSWEFTCSPCAQPHEHPTQHISFLTVLHRRIIWSSSSQLYAQRRLIQCLHLYLIMMHPTHGNSHVHLMLSHRHAQLRRSPFSLRYT
jgi:hypothetical protein